MSSHELARKLLEMPDVPVKINNYNSGEGDGEIASIEEVNGSVIFST